MCTRSRLLLLFTLLLHWHSDLDYENLSVRNVKYAKVTSG